MCAYKQPLPPSASSQLRSQGMTADCGAIVLMLIEYSMWSFHECLLAQFFYGTISKCAFFSPPHFQIRFDTVMEAI